MKKIFIAGTLGLAFLLTGCSSEPSDSDVVNAVKTAINDANAQSKKIAGGTAIADSFRIEFISARKISCTKTETDAKYNCEVEIETKAPMAGQTKGIKTVPLIKDGSDWKVAL